MIYQNKIIRYLSVDGYMNNIKEIVDKKIVFDNILSDVPIQAYRIEAIRKNIDGRLL